MKIIDNLLKEYQLKKADKEYTAELNLRNALNIKDFKRSYDKLKTLQLEIAKAEYKNMDAVNLKNEFYLERQNLHNIAKQNKIDTKSLKPIYECPKCLDTGFVNGEFCECFKSALSKKLLLASGLNYNDLPDFDNMSYEIVKNPQQKDTYVKIAEILKKYASKLNETDKKIILLSGEVGVGKTHLLKATANEAIKLGAFAVYTTAFDLNKKFLEYHCASLEHKDNVLEKYLNCDLLLIDDLGTENILKNVTVEYLYLIINQRLESNKNTVITTNLNMAELKNIYDERIMSRLSNKHCCIAIEFKGDDLRLN